MPYLDTDSQLHQSHLDAAMISIDRLSALADLLADEDVAAAFARLSVTQQASIFGSFEAGLQQARVALFNVLENDGGPHVQVND